ncbi:hypothetical protein EDB19DRAFT_1830226 [Suillus lakei]|nr:hypothetical protein EDB19DRAFT_1830226 [Suillus lakei]
MSTPKHLKKPLLQQAGAEDSAMPSPESLRKPHFTLASVAALYLDSFVPGFSNAERHAAACALLRHESHQDGTHYHTETPSSLHPSFIKFNKILMLQDQKTITHEEFVEAALEDVFDAVHLFFKLSLYDFQCNHLDGGISLLIRCPGSQATDSLTAECIAVNVGGDISLFVQGFCEQMAKHHLQRFTEWCCIEDIQPPHRYLAPQVNPTGSQALPAPLVLTGSHIQCSAWPPLNLNRNFEILSTTPKDSSDTLIRPPSSFIQHATALASASLTTGSNTKPRRRQLTDVFSLPKNAQSSNSPTPVIVYGPLIISIGPNTDVVLDRFKMGDGLIPRLCELMTTVCNTHWEATLRSPKWGLTFEQAVHLTNALNADLQGSKLEAIMLLQLKLMLAKTFQVLGIMTIASSNGKTIRRVQHDLYMGQRLLQLKHSKLSVWNAFCWKKNQTADKENSSSGKAILWDLVQENHTEYHELSDNAKASLLKEYEEHKAVKTTGTHISTKSKVNDVTQTLKAIENELNSLRCWTGTETILYTTHGSTDLPLCGIAFATEGVQDFMESIMNLDNQDLISKMEGFTMSGMHEEATGDPDVKMQWVHYWHNVVQRYLVICEGWPVDMPFENLSKVSSSLTDLEMLLYRGKKCTHACSPDDNDENPPPRCHKAKKCTHADKNDENDENLSPRCCKKTYKSLPSVDTDADTDNNNNVNSDINSDVNTDVNTQLEPSASLTTNDNELASLSGTGAAGSRGPNVDVDWNRQQEPSVDIEREVNIGIEQRQGGENEEEDGVGMLNIEVEQRMALASPKLMLSRGRENRTRRRMALASPKLMLSRGRENRTRRRTALASPTLMMDRGRKDRMRRKASASPMQRQRQGGQNKGKDGVGELELEQRQGGQNEGEDGIGELEQRQGGQNEGKDGIGELEQRQGGQNKGEDGIGELNDNDGVGELDIDGDGEETKSWE